MIMDLHIHSHHSHDAAKESICEYLYVAESMNLQYIAITDHVEINRFFPCEYYHTSESDICSYNNRKVFSESVAEILENQPKSKKVKLLCGAEVGQICQNIELATMIYQNPNIDLIIGSVHELPGLPDFYYLDYENMDIDKLVNDYFMEVLKTARTDCYDILAHLTFGLRFIPNREKYDLKPHYPIIDEIFMTLIEKRKSLELNGSGLKSPIPYTDPGIDLLCRYYQLGGRLLTLGSDSHDKASLGSCIDLLEKIAYVVGFSELTWYDKHIPHKVQL